MEENRSDSETVLTFSGIFEGENEKSELNNAKDTDLSYPKVINFLLEIVKDKKDEDNQILHKILTDSILK